MSSPFELFIELKCLMNQLVYLASLSLFTIATIVVASSHSIKLLSQATRSSCIARAFIKFPESLGSSVWWGLGKLNVKLKSLHAALIIYFSIIGRVL